MTLAAAVLVASLLGSLHCAAMCGAFTCLYAPTGTAWRDAWRGHLAYNLGRLVSYLVLGALAGTIGAALTRAGVMAGVSNGAAVVAAILLILWGVHAMVVARGGRIAVVRPPQAWQDAMGRVLQRFFGAPPVTRAAATGLLTTLLPCGWLYAFVVTAAGTGSAPRAAAMMAVFWVGTLPMMLTVGALLQRLSGRLRQRLPELSAAMIVILGVVSLAAHLEWLPSTGLLHRLSPAVPVAAGAEVVPHAHAP